MNAPRALTQDEIVKAFGDPRPYLLLDGHIDTGWEQEILRTFMLPAPLPLAGVPKVLVKRARCHIRVAPFLADALKEIHATPGLWATINDWAGCYAWRLQRNARVLSTHCWGLGPDMDVADNAQGDTTPGIDPRVVAIMEKQGFYWGGHFKDERIDGMHFQFGDPSRLK